MTLRDYVAEYERYRREIDNGLEAFEEAIRNFAKHFGEAHILEKKNHFIEFQVVGLKIKISLVPNITNDIGYLRWYLLYFNEQEQKDQGRLVLEHYFDALGNIAEDRSTQNATCNFRSEFVKYFYKTLLTFCRAVDNDFAEELLTRGTTGF